MATLMATSQSALSPPSWDETIVPSLRKRLESESRILSKRLSTISITDEVPGQQLPDSHSTRRKVSPSRKPPANPSTTNSVQPQRPSAIPRPSYTRERPTATSSTNSRAPESAPKSDSKRKRTQSTPFPFDANASSSSASNVNDVPLPSSSGLGSRVQSPLGRVTPTPSRIPTVTTSRMRSGSQSSQGVGSISGGKASLPPSQTFSSSDGISVDHADPTARTLSTKKSSSSFSQKRIVDKPPQPFPTGRAKDNISKVPNDRVSSDEERPFQHWYRGDVSRNGGVGEYRVGRRMEMLDIANFGHKLQMARRTRPYEEPGTHTENYAIASPRKRADSFSSVDRTSMYMDSQNGIVNGRVMDETPLTDIEAETDFERDNSGDFTYGGFAQSFGQSPVSVSDTPLPQLTSPDLAQAPISQLQTKVPRDQLRMASDTFTASITTITSKSPAAGPSNTKPNNQPRGRTQSTTADRSAATKAKSKSKTRPQKQLKNAGGSSTSASELVPSELGDYTGLADAVPETRSPVARGGNWDEVILPTVARRMGIEYEKEDPAKKKMAEPPVPPAPGTFGFDHSKYKLPRRSEEFPMNEFGQRNVIEEQQDQEMPPALGDEGPSPSVEFQAGTGIERNRPETPPPFSHYSPPLAVDVTGYDRLKERQDVPQIVVRPPTVNTAAPSEDTHGAGCCKCVVM